MKRVVVIGGGTGVYTVLSGLRDYPVHLTAVVSMADDGGSTGSLREEFGILPPGDIRRALVALSDSNNKILSDLFNFRFEENSSLHGHSLGNLLITALEKITGSFDQAIEEAVKILNINGDVIPVTLSRTKLFAILEDGTQVEGETNIDIPKHNPDLHISELRLDPPVLANPKAIQAILSADVVILGPGDVYTSILPNILAEGIKDAIKNTRAKVLYIVNIMTKYGETNNFKAADFLSTVEKYLVEGSIDACLINTEKPHDQTIIERYKGEHVEFVENDFKSEKVGNTEIVTGDFLRKGMFLRHDPKKLAKTLNAIIAEL